MKFFHLSDLHLGRKLLGESLLEEQAYIIEEIIKTAKEEKPDAVLMCGDIYDKSVPSAEAVRLLDGFLSQLVECGCSVFLISGNHDGGSRLEFAGKILEKENIYIEGTYKGKLEAVCLEDAWGEVYIHMLPFLRPDMLRPYEEELPKSYEEAVKTVLLKQPLKASARHVLMAHQFVTAGGRAPETDQSEQLILGGLDHVEVSCFEGFDYVALGHIHRAQSVNALHIRYAGSPLAYSFSENKDLKSLTIVELMEKGNNSVRKVLLQPKTKMAVLKDTMEALVSEKYQAYRKGYFLSIRLTDEEIPEYPLQRLRQVFSGILEFSVENRRTVHGGISGAAGLSVLKKTPETLFGDFYEKQNGVPLNETEKEILRELIREVQVDV